MHPPEHLDPVAQAYFRRNAPAAMKNGSLTDATLDSFAELCEMYSAMRGIDRVRDPKGVGKYTSLAKLHNQIARYFGLCPHRPPENDPQKKVENLKPFRFQ